MRVRAAPVHYCPPAVPTEPKAARRYPWRVQLFHDEYDLCANLLYDDAVRFTRQYATPAPPPRPRQFKSTIRANQLMGHSYDSAPSWTWQLKNGYARPPPSPSKVKGAVPLKIEARAPKIEARAPLSYAIVQPTAPNTPVAPFLRPAGLPPHRPPSFYKPAPSHTLPRDTLSATQTQLRTAQAQEPILLSTLSSPSPTDLRSSIDTHENLPPPLEVETPAQSASPPTSPIVPPLTASSTPASLRLESESTGTATEEEDGEITVEVSSSASVQETTSEEIEIFDWKPRRALVLSSYKAARDAGYGWRILSTRQPDLGWTLGCSTTAILALRNARCPARIDIAPSQCSVTAGLWRVTNYESTHNHTPNSNEVLKDWKEEKDFLDEYARILMLRSEGFESVEEWKGFETDRQCTTTPPFEQKPSSSSALPSQHPKTYYPLSTSSPSLSIDDLTKFLASINLALAEFATPLFEIGLTSYEALITFMQSPVYILDKEDIGNYVLRRVLSKELVRVRKELGLRNLDSAKSGKIVLPVFRMPT